MQGYTKLVVTCQRALPWLALALAACVVLFFGAIGSEIRSTHVYYAEIAQRIVETGDWLTLRSFDNGHSAIPVYVNKPPLMFWLAAINFHLFGESTFAATFWSQAMGVACVLLTAALGRQLFGRAIGWWAGVCMLGTGAFVSYANRFYMDQGLIAGMLLALLGWTARQRDWRGPALVSFGLALGAWSKGPLVALVALPMLGEAIAMKRWQRTDRASWRWLWLLPAMPVAFGWQWTLPLRFGDAVTKRWIADATTDANHVIWQWRPYLTMWWIEYGRPLLQWWPWLPACVMGTVLAWRARHGSRRGAVMLVLTWIVTFVIAVSLLRMMTRYGLIILPAAAMLAAWPVARRSRYRLPRWAGSGLAVIAVIAAIVTAVVPIGRADARPALKQVRTEVDSRLTPGAPMPLWRQAEAGGHWWDVSWVRFYLGREVAVIDPHTGFPPFFISVIQARAYLQGDNTLELVATTRHMALWRRR